MERDRDFLNSLDTVNCPRQGHREENRMSMCILSTAGYCLFLFMFVKPLIQRFK